SSKRWRFGAILNLLALTFLPSPKDIHKLVPIQATLNPRPVVSLELDPSMPLFRVATRLYSPARCSDRIRSYPPSESSSRVHGSVVVSSRGQWIFDCYKGFRRRSG